MQKVILITGTSSGLGKEISNLLSMKNVVYGGVRNLQDFEAGERVIPIKLDVTNDTQCKKAIETIIKKEGRIDVLINNAGYTISGPDFDFSVSDFQQILDTNSIGPFRLIKYVVPQMKKQKSGKIINITSLNGLVSFPNFGLYSASKHALEAFGVALHYELKKFGINVTSLAPGAIFSENHKPSNLQHKPAREKFKILYLLMPMVTRRRVAKRVELIISSKNPPAEIVMGADALITTFLKRFAPSFFWDYLMSFVWNKK